MKVYVFFAAALLLICSGCVAYTYSDPYYNDYPYRSHYYYGAAPSYYPYGSLFYPNIYLDYSVRSHRHHHPYRDHRYRGYRH